MYHAVVHLNATRSLEENIFFFKKKIWKKIDFIYVLWKLGVKLF